MCRPAVSSAVQALTRAGLVRQVGYGASTGGRPPAVVWFERRGEFVVGVELGAPGVDGAVTDLTAEIIAHVAAATDITDDRTWCRP